MKTASEIRNETDPFLREIWAAGYDEIYRSDCTQEIILVKKEPMKEKRISRFDLNPHGYSIVRSILLDGGEHRWIEEADGSAERFRKLIS